MAALLTQGILLIVSMSAFRAFPPRVFYLALVGYWIVALTVVLIRPRSPSSAALMFLALGFLAFYAAAQFIEPMI